jgi:uncharacterized protein YndB with AHSA1/START domain
MSEVEDKTLVLTRVFDAPPADVFDAWLSREEWQAWIGPEGVDCDVSLLEPHVGGRYRLEMRLASGRLPVAGVFRVIDRPRTLSFTWGAPGDPSRQSLVTLTFVAVSGGTELTLRQEGLPSVASREDHHHGWNSALNKLERYLRREAPR